MCHHPAIQPVSGFRGRSSNIGGLGGHPLALNPHPHPHQFTCRPPASWAPLSPQPSPIPKHLQAPCIVFIDEFDGLGKARSSAGMGDDESVHTINQLLSEMDGFGDNTGIVVMAATNRPAALDEALTRPGRFDRIIHLPIPNLEVSEGVVGCWVGV